MADYTIVDRGAVRDTLGEGLLWSPRDDALYWTDILAPALNRLSFADRTIERWPMPEPIGWVIQRRDALGFIAGFQSGFAELTLDPVSIVPMLDPEPDLPNNRLNDAKADAAGRIWAGSMPVSADRPTGSLYRLDAQRRVARMDTGYIVANGPAFSPDGRWLYHNDTGLRRVYRFALMEDGSIGERTVFIAFDEGWGRPDGMTVDIEGGLWIAHWGGARVSRFTPDGALDRVIALPTTQITNVCFAGAGLDRMFITSAAEGLVDQPLAGCLFEVDPGARGLPPGQFAG